jgi:hypothetical protein
MCTHCGVFAFDFAEIFCDCGRKFDYVDVSDVDTLRIWLKNLALSDSKDHKSDRNSDCETIPEEYPEESPLVDELHKCHIGEDCTNDDCIDCSDRKYEFTDDEYDTGFYGTYHECCSECGSSCRDYQDEAEDWDCDCDSIS